MLDAGFLEAEDSDRHVSLAIGALSVIAGPMPDFDSLVAGLTERILSVPRFRQVLRTRPLDIGAPQWVDGAVPTRSTPLGTLALLEGEESSGHVSAARA